MGEVLVPLAGDKSCNIQGLCSAVYGLLSIHHGKPSCLLIVNGDRCLVRDIEDILVPGHFGGAFFIFKPLELHEIILRYQESALEASHEETSAFQD